MESVPKLTLLYGLQLNYINLTLSVGKPIINFKMTAFWDIAPCSLVEADRRFRGTYGKISKSRVKNLVQIRKPVGQQRFLAVHIGKGRQSRKRKGSSGRRGRPQPGKWAGRARNTKFDRNMFSTFMVEMYKQADGHKLQNTYSVRALCTKNELQYVYSMTLSDRQKFRPT
jgi:hypothetical protein